MSWVRFFRRKRSDAELQEEIENFLTEETADNEARGMSPDEAGRHEPEEELEPLFQKGDHARADGMRNFQMPGALPRGRGRCILSG